MNLIIITALWCPSCLIMRNRYNHIMIKYPRLTKIELDYDLDKISVAKYNTGKILPIAILFDHDKELMRIIGEKTEKELLLKLEVFLHD